MQDEVAAQRDGGVTDEGRGADQQGMPNLSAGEMAFALSELTGLTDMDGVLESGGGTQDDPVEAGVGPS
jgi:hypothetical protein